MKSETTRPIPQTQEYSLRDLAARWAAHHTPEQPPTAGDLAYVRSLIDNPGDTLLTPGYVTRIGAFYNYTQLGADLIAQLLPAAYANEPFPELRVAIPPELQGEWYEVVTQDGDQTVGLGDSYSHYIFHPSGEISLSNAAFTKIWKIDETNRRAAQEIAAIKAGCATGKILWIRRLNTN